MSFKAKRGLDIFNRRVLVRTANFKKKKNHCLGIAYYCFTNHTTNQKVSNDISLGLN